MLCIYLYTHIVVRIYGWKWTIDRCRTRLEGTLVKQSDSKRDPVDLEGHDLVKLKTDERSWNINACVYHHAYHIIYIYICLSPKCWWTKAKRARWSERGGTIFSCFHGVTRWNQVAWVWWPGLCGFGVGGGRGINPCSSASKMWHWRGRSLRDIYIYIV